MNAALDSAVSIAFHGLAFAMVLYLVSVGLSITMGLMGFVTAFVFPAARARTMWMDSVARVCAAICVLLTAGAFAMMFRSLMAFAKMSGAR